MFSGKTSFIFKLVKHRELVFNHTFHRILYCIPPGTVHLKPDLLHAFKSEYSAIEIIEGLPDLETNNLNENEEHKLVLSKEKSLNETHKQKITSEWIETIFFKADLHLKLSVKVLFNFCL